MKKVIEIRNLRYVYPDGTEALSQINLKISKGEAVALVGPNGAGKTTLLLHLNGILNGEGEVKILGLPITKENLREIRSKVGLVFQDPDDQLFLATVFDDVAFGPLNLGLPTEEVRERVKKALDEVGMLEAVSKSAHHLSFGEKKRVAIATVLSMNSEILAFDEPTSNLDPRSRRHLIEILKTFPQTKIFATHDINFAWEVCHRAIILDGGKIVADGPVKKIFTDQELLERHGLELPSRVSTNLLT